MRVWVFTDRAVLLGHLRERSESDGWFNDLWDGTYANMFERTHLQIGSREGGVLRFVQFVLVFPAGINGYLKLNVISSKNEIWSENEIGKQIGLT